MATPASVKKMEETKRKAQEWRDKKRVAEKFSLSAQQPNGITSYSTLYNGFLQPPSGSSLSGPAIDFTSDEDLQVPIASVPIAGIRQYTSFETKSNGQSSHQQQPRPPSKAPPKPYVAYKQKRGTVIPEVEALPNGMAYDAFTVSRDSLVCFHGKEHYLSSFYPARITIDGNVYGSVEQYYQACKLYELAGPQHAAELRHVNSPIHAKVTARNVLRQSGVKDETVESWKMGTGLSMLYHATLHKFVQNVSLRQQLVNTGKAILAHAYDKDTQFACGMNKEGLEKWAHENEGMSLKLPSGLADDLMYFPLVGKGKNLMGVICMLVRKQLEGKSTTSSLRFLENYLERLAIGSKENPDDAATQGREEKKSDDDDDNETSTSDNE